MGRTSEQDGDLVPPSWLELFALVGVFAGGGAWLAGDRGALVGAVAALYLFLDRLVRWQRKALRTVAEVVASLHGRVIELEAHQAKK